MNDIDPAQKPEERLDLKEYRKRREAANAANAEIEARRRERAAKNLGRLGLLSTEELKQLNVRSDEIDGLRAMMEKDPTGRTSEEEAILDRNRHNIGARNVAHASIDYDGSLGGGSPSNPIRVPGVVHQ